MAFKNKIKKDRQPISNTNLLLTITICTFAIMYLFGMIVFGGGFLNPQQLFDIFNNNAYLIMVACGLTIVMITGGIDISVGGTVALITMTSVVVMESHGGGIFTSILISLGIGLAMGAVQGFCVAYLKIQPFIVTLAGMFFTRGMTTIVSKVPVTATNEKFNALKDVMITLPGIGHYARNGRFINSYIEVGVIIVVVVLLLLWAMLRWTRFGRNLYAVGGNNESALMLGINVQRTKFFAYLLTGLLAGIGGFVYLLHTGAGNAANEGAGFYLRRDATNKVAGLYVGNWEQKLAVLGLRPGDKVTFKYSGTDISDNNANIHVENENSQRWLTQLSKGQTATETVDINFIGDLIIKPNKGTIINSITIDSEIAEYNITTEGSTTTFEFTKKGLLEENDFAIPYMSVSFGNKNDYLVVGDDLQSRMIKSNGTETLETDANIGWQPVAGNFYAFRPTGGGTVTIEGGIQGARTHLFVYNNGWEGADGQFYKATYNTDDDHYISFSFDVEKDKIYYICINNQDNNEHGNAFHLHKFTFTNTFHLTELAKVVDLDQETGSTIFLTQIQGAGGLGQNPVHVKKCSGNIDPTRILPETPIDRYGNLYINKPTFLDETKDKAGTVILDINTQGGEATYVVTFPYHANYGWDETIGRSAGHTWNFIDPRNSDSNSGNSKVWDGYSGFNDGPATTGILSIGQYKNPSSQMRHETDDREWTYSQRQTGSAGGFHDPYYANVFDMEGDNADMIWETEGLWFDTGTNLSCIHNEKDAYDQSLTNPLDFAVLGTDPDRYVGLMPVTDDKKSSFTIPGLKDGDRVLIFMKSGEATADNGIFLNITGAKDA